METNSVNSAILISYELYLFTCNRKFIFQNLPQSPK